jgi:hypothetical protein
MSSVLSALTSSAGYWFTSRSTGCTDRPKPRSPSQRPAADAQTHPRLNQWASIFTMRQVTVQCSDQKTWSEDEIADGGWAYVPGGPPMSGVAAHTVAAPPVCEGALAIAEGRRATPPWEMALGALTLLHEAYHLRIWNQRLDGGRVNCEAIRHLKVGVRLLGGSQQLANELLPYALSIYWELAVKGRRTTGSPAKCRVGSSERALRRLVAHRLDPRCVRRLRW